MLRVPVVKQTSRRRPKAEVEVRLLAGIFLILENAMTDSLSYPVLVLNRGWAPIRADSVKNAISLVCKGSAKFVEPESYQTFDFDDWAALGAERDRPHIATINLRIRIPEVILLTLYGGTPRREIVFSRRNVFRRDRCACQYCGARPGMADLTLDHVLARSRGGVSSWENLVVACLDCNKRKANRTPAEARMKLRRAPLKPKWTPSFIVPIAHRRESWNAFLSRAYWNVPLDP